MRAIRLLAALSLVAGSLVFAAPVAAGDPCYHGFDLPTRSEGTDPQIKMTPCAFAPAVVRVAPGTTVQWFSGPDFVHLLTGANQEWGSRDDEIQPDSVVAYRFDKPGIYPYACALHRGMSGTIVVGNGIAAAGPVGAAGAAVVRVAAPGAPAGPGASTPPTAATAKPAAAPAATRALASMPAQPSSQSATDRSPVVPIAAAFLAIVVIAGVVAARLAGVHRPRAEAGIEH
jgi:plastocyanin